MPSRAFWSYILQPTHTPNTHGSVLHPASSRAHSPPPYATTRLRPPFSHTQVHRAETHRDTFLAPSGTFLQALELSRQQEVTKQAESKEREADYRRQAAALEKVGW